MNTFQHLLLASQSPRRRMMIAWLGIAVSTTATQIDERTLLDETPRNQAMRLAVAKARAIPSAPETWILAADTMVDLEGQALGKPKNIADAIHTLHQLRSRPHQVHTGIALFVPETNTLFTRLVTTSVQMRPYTDAEISAYVATGDPMDKAGAYAVQHPQFRPVAHLARCYANVVGFPLCAIVTLLREMGADLVAVDIPALCQKHFNYVCPASDEGACL